MANPVGLDCDPSALGSGPHLDAGHAARFLQHPPDGTAHPRGQPVIVEVLARDGYTRGRLPQAFRLIEKLTHTLHQAFFRRNSCSSRDSRGGGACRRIRNS